MLRTGLPYLTTEQGLTPRALRDLQKAKRAGRFAIDDPHVALACTGGALLGVLQLASTQARPSHIDRAADELAVNLLRMFGVPMTRPARSPPRSCPASANPQNQPERHGMQFCCPAPGARVIAVGIAAWDSVGAGTASQPAQQGLWSARQPAKDPDGRS